MKIKQLKELLTNLDQDGEVFVELHDINNKNQVFESEFFDAEIDTILHHSDSRNISILLKEPYFQDKKDFLLDKKIDIQRSTIYRCHNGVVAKCLFLNEKGYFCNDKNFSKDVVIGIFSEINQNLPNKKCFKCGNEFYKFFIPETESEFIEDGKEYKRGKRIKTREEFVSLTGFKEGDKILMIHGLVKKTPKILKFTDDGILFNGIHGEYNDTVSYRMLSRTYDNSCFHHKFWDTKTNKWRKFLIY